MGKLPVLCDLWLPGELMGGPSPSPKKGASKASKASKGVLG
jgi:hypothetical protein